MVSKQLVFQKMNEKNSLITILIEAKYDKKAYLIYIIQQKKKLFYNFFKCNNIFKTNYRLLKLFLKANRN